MHPIRFRLGSRPRPRLRSLQRSWDPLAGGLLVREGRGRRTVWKGPTSKARGGEKWGKVSSWRWGETDAPANVHIIIWSWYQYLVRAFLCRVAALDTTARWGLLLQMSRSLVCLLDITSAPQKRLDRSSWAGPTTRPTIHPLNSLISRTTWVSRYQKGKTSLDLNEARDGPKES